MNRAQRKRARVSVDKVSRGLLRRQVKRLQPRKNKEGAGRPKGMKVSGHCREGRHDRCGAAICACICHNLEVV